jgi:hypothetical protein
MAYVFAAAGFSALLVGAGPANAQLMNENSQVIPTPGNPQLGESGLGMSDVVKQSGPPRTLFGYIRRDNGSARNRRVFRND